MQYLKYLPTITYNMKRQSLRVRDVYDILVRIPEGKVTTYGDISRALGRRPGASRAIGGILNRNPNPGVVPCHRVGLSDGSVGGYAFGTARKKELLGKEGLRFMGDSMDDF